MGDRFARLRELSPPPEAAVVWVETDDEALHFLDAAFSAMDGVANVRREYRDVGGRKLFKIYVAPGSVDEVLRVLRAAAEHVTIGEIQIEP
ncbi:MAG: hypothetical protein NUV94_02320 [Candidatus Acetothermia bacterium]|jgi:FAD/FMN-containing dehydrogenase|nr:hypothetical protein [Candidatus Acetothermia bacterium]